LFPEAKNKDFQPYRARTIVNVLSRERGVDIDAKTTGVTQRHSLACGAAARMLRGGGGDGGGGGGLVRGCFAFLVWPPFGAAVALRRRALQ
jgi:hypothetical protein